MTSRLLNFHYRRVRIRKLPSLSPSLLPLRSLGTGSKEGSIDPYDIALAHRDRNDVDWRLSDDTGQVRKEHGTR